MLFELGVIFAKARCDFAKKVISVSLPAGKEDQALMLTRLFGGSITRVGKKYLIWRLISKSDFKRIRRVARLNKHKLPSNPLRQFLLTG